MKLSTPQYLAKEYKLIQAVARNNYRAEIAENAYKAGQYRNAAARFARKLEQFREEQA